MPAAESGLSLDYPHKLSASSSDRVLLPLLRSSPPLPWPTTDHEHNTSPCFLLLWIFCITPICCILYHVISGFLAITTMFPSFSWLPSLPSIDFALPSSIQKRFISFALRQSLGHLLKPGQLDIQQVDSQIGSGYVQVRDLELNNEVSHSYQSFTFKLY